MRTRGLVVAWLLMACGGGNEDDIPDAATSPDANAANVQVTVIDLDGSAASGVGVVVSAPDGTIGDRALADNTGHASVFVHAGDSVTAAYTTPFSTTSLETVAGVQPGDDLVLGAYARTSAGMFKLVYPAAPGNGQYLVYGPCAGGNAGNATTVMLPMSAECIDSSSELLVVAVNTNQYLVAENVTITSGGAYTFPGPWLDLTGTLEGDYTNLPNDVTGVQMFSRIPTAQGFSTGSGGAPTGGAVTLGAFTPGVGDVDVTSAFSSSGGGNRTVSRQTDPVGPYLFDGSTLMPALATPSFDVATETMTVDSAGTPDVVIAGLSYGAVEWYLVEPAGGAIVLPALPSDMAPMPTASDTVLLYTSAERFGLAYDAIRPVPGLVVWGHDDDWERRGTGVVETSSFCVGCP